MANVTPNRLVLRCYGHKTRNGRWFGVCLDLDLAVEADSPAELKSKMNDVISSYFEVVLDTDDRASIPDLLTRRAPFFDWVKYFGIRLLVFIREFPGNFIFKESIPFHLAHNC